MHITCKYTQRVLPEGINLDLFFAEPGNWGLVYAIRTGSSEYSHRVLANAWVKKGYTSIGGYLTKEGHRFETREEEDLFRRIGIEWVPAEERNL